MKKVVLWLILSELSSLNHHNGFALLAASCAVIVAVLRCYEGWRS